MKALWFSLAVSLASIATAEPYLAVQTGLSCATCHTNASGGGMRNQFGNTFAQSELPAQTLGAGSEPLWTGTVFDRFAVGGNARASGRQFEFEDRDDNLNFDVDRVTLYLSVQVNQHVRLYVDEQVAPGGSLNREAWGQVTLGNWYVKAGKLFLPFGWRLEDDTAFVRQISGINFASGDNGLELGFNSQHWEFQLAATNGTAGGAEVDDGKQFSFLGAYLHQRWRIGVSANSNNTDNGERTMYGVFGGARTGPVSWLVEYDVIEDEDLGPLLDREQAVALLEANINFLRGHNFKLTAEANTFDDDNDDVEDRFRYSAVWEYFPLAFTQLRIGVRTSDSDDVDAALNGDEVFVQAHIFF